MSTPRMKVCVTCGMLNDDSVDTCTFCASTIFASGVVRPATASARAEAAGSDLLSGTLTGESRGLWDLAEAAKGPEAAASLAARKTSGSLDELLAVLALQNAGRHGDAQKRLDGVAQAGADLLSLWARVERVYAERKQIVRTDPPAGLSDVPQTKPQDPLAQLVLARRELALGLVATRASQYDDANQHIMAALMGMRGIGSRAGVAVATSELARLSVWRGDVAAADRHVKDAIGQWEAIGARQAAGSLWHDFGYLLLNTGQADEAVMSFQRALELMEDPGKSARTENGLASALLAAGKHGEARKAAEGVLTRIESGIAEAEAARQKGANTTPRNAEDDTYRRVMALRCLGEIELRQEVVDQETRGRDQRVHAAEGRLVKAVALMGEPCSREDPVCPRWVGELLLAASRKDSKSDPRQFEKLELVKLEALIHAERRPGEAGRHLDRVAEIFALRGEYLEELKTRGEAASAFERAGDTAGAIAQIERALRIATARDAHSIAVATALEQRLAKLRGTQATAPAPKEGEERKTDFAVVTVERMGGRLVRRHRYRVEGAEKVAVAERALPHLRELAGQVRVLRGLPAVLPPLEKERREGDTIAFDIVVEHVEGASLAEAMKRRPRTREEVKRAVRIFRMLASAVDALHRIGATDVRPEAALVRLSASDEPVLLDILPLHRTPRTSASDVEDLVRQLAGWLSGSKAPRRWPADVYVSRRFPFLHLRWSIFPGRLRQVMPPELDQLLTDAVTTPGHIEGWRPCTLADRLQEFS